MARRQVERKMGAAVTALASGLGGPGVGLGQAMYGLAADAPRISFIPVEDIAPNPDQPRRIFDAQAQQELADSIHRVGLLQPILVRANEQAGEGPQWLIVAGERRWRAVCAVGQPTIAAIVTGRDPDEAALIENVQRQDLHAVELARAVARLAERHGYKQEELAAALGKSQGEVSKLMRILTLPSSILDEAGTMPGMTRAALYRLTMAEEEEREALWQEMTAADTAAQPVAAPSNRRKTSATGGDAVSRAISSFGAKVEKLKPMDLTDEQRQKLQGLRDAIDALLIIPQE